MYGEKRMSKASKSGIVIKALLFLFLLFSVILPLICMLLNVLSINVPSILFSEQFLQATLNSFTVTLTATTISVMLAMLLAWMVARSNIRYKGTISMLLTLPMLIPSISHGMGLVVLLGSNGVLTNLFHLQFRIYGFWGIVMGSVMYSFPVAFLMLLDIFKYEDYSVYESAQVLGIPKKSQLFSITLPYLRKPMISVIFATFTLIFTDYGVPLMVGGKFTTLPVYMYNEVIGLLNFGKGAVVGLVLMIPALIAFLFDLFNKDVGSQSFVTRKFQIKKSTIRDGISYFLTILTILLVALPIIAFALLTFVEKYPINMNFSWNNILQSMDLGSFEYLINSLIIAFFTSLIGTIVSYITAYYTSRNHGKSSKTLHLISITSLAIPGIVLGLSYSLFFQKSFLAGTLAILILVNSIHFFASPYLMAYNAMNKINPNFEPVSYTLGIKTWRLVKDVFIPQTFGTILEMFSYFFVNSMITISAVSFVSNVSTMPIALMIPQFEGQMLLECSAFISLIVLIVNLFMKGIIFLSKYVYTKRHTS